MDYQVECSICFDLHLWNLEFDGVGGRGISLACSFLCCLREMKYFLWHEFYRNLSHVIRSCYSTNVHLLRTLLYWTLLIHIFFCCWKWWSVHCSTNNQIFSYLYYNNFPFAHVCSSSLFNGISISSGTSQNAKGLTATIVLSLSSVPLLRGSFNLIKQVYTYIHCKGRIWTLFRVSYSRSFLRSPLISYEADYYHNKYTNHHNYDHHQWYRDSENIDASRTTCNWLLCDCDSQ